MGDQIVYQALMNRIANTVRDLLKTNARRKSFSHILSGMRSHSFYQPWNVGYRQFTGKIIDAHKNGLTYVGTFDLLSCYDTIDHALLESLLQARNLDSDQCRLLTECLETWSSHDQAFPLRRGIPQGPPGSGLLAEVVLHVLDEEVQTSRNLRYLRYVDDIRIMAKKEEAVWDTILVLDSACKRLGLFPQTSKIAVEKVANIREKIKSVSSPAELGIGGTCPRQAVVRSRAVELSNRFVIKDATRFKWVLAQAQPSLALSRRCLVLWKRYPHFSDIFLRYYSRYREVPVEISRGLYVLMKELSRFTLIEARILDLMLDRAPAATEYLYRDYAKRRWAESSTRGLEALSAVAILKWLSRHNSVTYNEIETVIRSHPEWWVRLEILGAIDSSTIGAQSRDDLLNAGIEQRESDVSLVASYCLVAAGGKLQVRRGNIDGRCQLILKDAGYLRRAGRGPTIIPKLLDEIFREDYVHVKWRSAFRSNTTQVERIIASAKAEIRSRNNPAGWVSQLDSFHDELLFELHRWDTKLGQFSHGSLGSVLHGSGRLYTYYPVLSAWAQAIHSLRLQSPYSHARVRSTGKFTRSVSQRDIEKAIKNHPNRYSELVGCW